MPKLLGSIIKEKNTLNLPVRVLFQDEARFGRMCIPVSCWAPLPYRPVVCRSIERQFKYIYASVCPEEGKLFYMVKDKMNTINMSRHLSQISNRMASNFVIMVVDGASSHTSKSLTIPSNIALLRLPPYSPELNPAEQIWRMLRGDYFGNRTFKTLDEAMDRARVGMKNMARDRDATIQLTLWPWISTALNAIRKYR